MVAQLTSFGLFGAALLLPALASAKVIGRGKGSGYSQSIFKDDEYATSHNDVDLSRFRPATFIVHGEASIPRPADIANIELSLYIEGPTKENVTAEANDSMAYVKNLLNVLSAPPTAHFDGDASFQASFPVEKWNAGAITSREDKYASRRHGRKDADDEDEERVFYANAHLSVRFRDLGLVPAFSKNVTNSSQFTVDWINWKLSDKEKAAAEMELKKKAWRNMVEAGQQYADIFNVALGTMLEFEEESSNAYVDRDDDMFGNRWGEYDFDFDEEDREEWEPPMMKMSLDVTAKFSHDGGKVM